MHVLLNIIFLIAIASPALASNELVIELEDGAEASVHQYPAAGQDLLIWIASPWGIVPALEKYSMRPEL